MTVTVLLVVLVKIRPVAAKVTWVALTGTVMLAGTLAVVVFERVSVNEVPLGAGPFRVIVPVEVSPAPIVVGLNVKLLGAGGCTVSVVVCVTSWLDAVMVTPVKLLTADGVVTVNCAVALPADTDTLAGTPTMPELELLRLTMRPPVGAGPVRATVPCTVLPVFPITEVGLTETLLSAIVFLTVKAGACRDAPR